MIETKTKDYGLLLLRTLPPVLLIVFHGWSKLTAALSYIVQGTEWKFIETVRGMGFPYPVFFASCAAFAESVCSLLLILGLFTRYAAILFVINFLVAVYRHTTTDLRIELAALYLIIGLTLLLTGPGRFSLDSYRTRKGR